MTIQKLGIGLLLFYAPMVGRGATISETGTLEYDVLSPDLSTVICSSALADCSAYRPLFDFELQKPVHLNQAAVGGNGFQISLGDLTAFANNSTEYAVRIQWTRTVSLTGIYKFTGGSGSGEAGWEYEKDIEGADFWASNARFDAAVSLFPTVITGEATDVATSSIVLNTPVPITITGLLGWEAIFGPGEASPNFPSPQYQLVALNGRLTSFNGVPLDPGEITIEEVANIPEPQSLALVVIGLGAGWILARSRVAARGEVAIQSTRTIYLNLRGRKYLL